MNNMVETIKEIKEYYRDQIDLLYEDDEYCLFEVKAFGYDLYCSCKKGMTLKDFRNKTRKKYLIRRDGYRRAYNAVINKINT